MCEPPQPTNQPTEMCWTEFQYRFKGARLALKRSSRGHSSCSRVHRLRGVSEIASAHTSRNLGPGSGETAPKRLNRIGARTDAAEPISFLTFGGPPARTNAKLELRLVFDGVCDLHSVAGLL